jgi:hypothetical protein
VKTPRFRATGVAAVSRTAQALLLLGLLSTSIGFTAAALWPRLRHPPTPVSQPRSAEAVGAQDLPGLPASGSHLPSGQSPGEIASGACARQREPRRLASGISASVALEALALRGSVDVLVGVGSSAGTALGLRLDTTTLQAHEAWREPGTSALLGVLPRARAQPARFVSDRTGVGGYRELRTLPIESELALARSQRGIVLLGRAEGPSVVLWALDADEEISRARVEWQDPQRLALAFRRGGRGGKLVLGWLDRRNLQRSPLRALPFEGIEFGLPSLALQKERAAVAVAVRHAEASSWRIQVATASWYGPITRVALPELTAQADSDSFAPQLVSLGQRGWLLQWTEGKERKRRVRALTLAPDFSAIGSVIDVSLPGQNAGGGLVVVLDQGLLSLFLVQTRSGYELWATTLACG